MQTSIWIRFTKDDDVVNLAFNSLMVNVYRGSDLDQIVEGMIAHMKFQIENPALPNSRFAFDKVLHLDVNFHQLHLTRGRSYAPLPDYIDNREAVINPQNDDSECFKWAIIPVDGWTDIGSHPERISNLRKFVNNYDWYGLEFPVSLKQIGKFEINNCISVNVLGLEDKEIHILRKCRTHKGGLDLLMVSENEINHCTAIKSLSRLLRSSNTKHHGKQYFCMNCLHGFPAEASLDLHRTYCENNEAVRVELPKNKILEFVVGQSQFKVPFVMYYDLESLLSPIPTNHRDPNAPYMNLINQHIPCGWNVRSKFAYGEVKNPETSYQGSDCIKTLCEHFIFETHRLYKSFPEKPMDPLSVKEQVEYMKSTRCHICSNPIAYGILPLSQLRGWDFYPTPQKTMLKLFD